MTFRRIAAALLAVCWGAGAWATDEIQVYNDDIDQPGEAALEMHTNLVIDGRSQPDYPGEMAPHHVLNLTPEFSYGVTEQLEAGLYVPFSYDAKTGDFRSNDAKLRAKWLQKSDASQQYYGINLELARNPPHISPDPWASEVRPIYGLRAGAWHFAINPILDITVSGKSHTPEFEPALKLSRQVADGVELGVEHYTDLGPINDLLPAPEQTHETYLVTDFRAYGYDFNLGIGYGWRNSDERWVIKLIVGGIPLIKK